MAVSIRTGLWRWIVVAIAVGGQVAGCGSGSGGGTGGGGANGGSDPTTAVTEPGATQSAVTENPSMSIEALCDPVQDDVAAWAGGAITPEHNALYADAAEPVLVCKWLVDGSDRSIRVDYVGVPDSFMHDLVDGKQDRTDVVAPNFHDMATFYVIAPNGWGVVVSNLGSERSEDVEPMVDIASTALALLPS